MQTLMNVLRTTELRNKILFTIFIIFLYRLGAQIPAPGSASTASRPCGTGPTRTRAVCSGT